MLTITKKEVHFALLDRFLREGYHVVNFPIRWQLWAVGNGTTVGSDCQVVTHILDQERHDIIYLSSKTRIERRGENWKVELTFKLAFPFEVGSSFFLNQKMELSLYNTTYTRFHFSPSIPSGGQKEIINLIQSALTLDFRFNLDDGDF